MKDNSQNDIKDKGEELTEDYMKSKEFLLSYLDWFYNQWFIHCEHFMESNGKQAYEQIKKLIESS